MRIKRLVLLISSILISGILSTSVFAAEDLELDFELNTSALEEKTQVCATCHGADGNSTIAINPKLAGQHEGYLYKQLSNFKEGIRANAVMAPQVKDLSEADMRAIAAFYAGKKPTLAKAKTQGKGSLGEQIYRGGIAATKVPACAACHGANGEGIPKRFPRVAGQHAAYTFQQMKIFRTDGRANAGMMQTIAKKMTEAEMEAVADYMQGLR